VAKNLAGSFYHLPLQYATDPEKLKEYTSKYDIFAIVRDPYSRAISETFDKWGGFGKFLQGEKPNTIEKVNKFMNNKLKTLEKLTKFSGHWAPQHLYTHLEDGTQIVKHIFKMDRTLNAEFTKLMRSYDIDLELNDYIKTNLSDNKPIEFKTTDINDENRKLINKIYKEDFSKFGFPVIG
jgi:hypothetical protein